MKNILRKFLIIFISFSLIISIFTISKAENEENTNENENLLLSENSSENDISLISDESEENPVVTSSSEDNESTVFHNLYLLNTEDIEVNQTVYGDVYICTTGTAKISSSISGNVFVCASNLVIEPSAEIGSAIYVAAKKVDFNGIVNGNVYVVSQEFNFNNGRIDTDLYLASSNVSLNGTIYRKASISCKDLNINTESTYIGGGLMYSADKELDISNYTVNGDIYYIPNTSNDNEEDSEIKDTLSSILSFTVTALILFVLIKLVHCKTFDNSIDLQKLPKYLLTGLLSCIVIPIIIVFLLMLKVTALLSLALLGLFFIILAFSSTLTIIAISKNITEKLSEKFKANKILLQIASIVVICILFKILQLIPGISIIITMLVGLTGLGLLIYSLLFSHKNKEL